MKLYIKQRVFSWGDKFTVKDENGTDVYRAAGEVFTWGKKLHLYDNAGQEVAFIRQKVISWLPRYYAEVNGRTIEVVKQISFFRPKYRVEGLPWRLEGDFFAHEYALIDDGGNTVMQMSKHWFTWGDSYELAIADPALAPEALCVALVVDCAVAQEQS
jgi:uncharacterized protein YxjI